MTVADLTRKTAGPEVVARHDGVCQGCQGAIRRGEDYIVKVDGTRGVFHPSCGRARCDVINEEVDRVAEEREERDQRFRQVCRELRDLDVPEGTIELVRQFAESGRR